MDKKLLRISDSPHIFDRTTTRGIMAGVLVSLIPPVIASVYFFGVRALGLVVTCTISSVATEAIWQKVAGKKIMIGDLSACVTGVLLALVLPPALPLWMAVVGGICAIALGKQIFGGLGFNIFNPTLIGRAFLMAAFPVWLTKWTQPSVWGKAHQAVTSATPLGLAKFEGVRTSIGELFLGNVGGCLGETSCLALLIGGIYLLIRRYADWRIPAGFIGTVAGLSWILYLINPSTFQGPLFHLFSGGLMLGALYMATDPVTSPVTKMGKWVFACGLGVIVVLIRNWGGLPEGVMYSILLGNACVPLINKFTHPRRFGT